MANDQPTNVEYEIAKKLANHRLGTSVTGIACALATARIQERDRCAKIARLAPGQDWGDDTTPYQMAHFIAETIEEEATF